MSNAPQFMIKNSKFTYIAGNQENYNYGEEEDHEDRQYMHAPPTGSARTGTETTSNGNGQLLSMICQVPAYRHAFQTSSTPGGGAPCLSGHREAPPPSGVSESRVANAFTAPLVAPRPIRPPINPDSWADPAGKAAPARPPPPIGSHNPQPGHPRPRGGSCDFRAMNDNGSYSGWSGAQSTSPQQAMYQSTNGCASPSTPSYARHPQDSYNSRGSEYFQAMSQQNRNPLHPSVQNTESHQPRVSSASQSPLSQNWSGILNGSSTSDAPSQRDASH